MPLILYPHQDDLSSSSLQEKLEVLLNAAERYKAVVLDATVKISSVDADSSKRAVPRDLNHAFNWQELANLFRLLRELPETNAASRLAKADKLAKLGEIYEVLRDANMRKLEAVRLALVNEVNQLRGSR